MNITRGKIPSAIRVGVYGTEGVGKTTFASRFPGAVFIDTEGSTARMDVARFSPVRSLPDVMGDIDEVIAHPSGIGTLVIDTVDWLEKLVFRAVCEEKKISNIEDLGYGKGYVYARAKMQEILEKLDAVISCGVHVVLVCHSIVRKFELPDEMGAYDRYTLKLNEKNIAPLIKEWVDMLLFVNYKTDVVTAADGRTKKGTGGQKRVMYAAHSACWDAKNRFGLPDELPFEYDRIASLFGEAAPIGASREVSGFVAGVGPVEAAGPGTVPAAGPGLPPAVPLAPVPAAASAPASAAVKKVSAVPPVAPADAAPVGTVPADAAPVDAPAAAPPPASRKKKGAAAPAVRPPEMKSDNPEKDRALSELWDRMVRATVPDPSVLRAVVAEKEYYDLATPVNEYDLDFIRDVLLEAWDQVSKLCQTKMYNLPF